MAPNLLNILSPNNIIIFMLVFTRMTGIIQSAPFFSTLNMPVMVKLWFCATIAFLIYPIVYTQKIYILPHNAPEFAILLAIEFFIGFLIGFLANLFLEGVGMCGRLLSIQTGLAMSEALDPISGMNSSELARIYIYLTTLVFISTGAHQLIFTTLFNSFQAVPMGVFPAFDENIVNLTMKISSQIFVIAFNLALPIFSVLFTCDVLLGMTSKMMPQMNIYMVALPVKIYLGLILIYIFLDSVIVYLQGALGKFMYMINTVFSG